MKKKSLVAMGLAGVMTVGMCVPVLAAGNINQDSEKKSEEVNVSYTEPVKYTVTIPADVTIAEGDAEQTMSIGIDSATFKIPYGNKINIASNVDTAGTLSLIDKDNNTNKINATVTKPSSNYFDKDNLAAIEYKVSKPDNVDYSGTYEGTITFTVSLVSSENS